MSEHVQNLRRHIAMVKRELMRGNPWGRGARFQGVVVGLVLGWCWVGAFGASGRSHCRVAAFGVSDLLRLADFFITISHCAWRRVISDMTFLVKSDVFDFVHVGGRMCAIS